MKLVYICSPYRDAIDYNISKARGYCRFASISGVIPFAPHLHNTQFLDDSIPEEREKGILLGLHMLKRCEELWCFGIKVTTGMMAELSEAKRIGIKIRWFDDRCNEMERGYSE